MSLAFRCLVLALGVAVASDAHAAGPLRTVLLPPEGDKLATKLAGRVELNLEDNENLILVAREELLDRLDKQDPFDRARLKTAMDNADIDVLLRFSRTSSVKGPILVTAYDREGLDIEAFEVTGVKSTADAKPEGKKAAARIAKIIAQWPQKRAARKEKADEEEKQRQAAEAESTDWDEGADDLPPPPAEEPEDAPRSRTSRTAETAEGEGGGRAIVGEEDETPPFPTEVRRNRRLERETAEAEAAEEDAPRGRKKAKEEPRRRGRLADDEDEESPRERSRFSDEEEEDDDGERKRPSRRGALAEVDAEKANPNPAMAIVKNLYSLYQPTPYLVFSVGPDVALWSYSLSDENFNRKTSVCAPDPKRLTAFRGCRPHGGGSLWLEVWPIRYIGIDSSVRLAGTVYAPVRNARGQQLTKPDQMAALLGEGHLALKARFVLHFGPLPGIAAGGRIRVGYSRGAVERQTPVVAIPGYHAAQLGLGPEFHIPLLWRRLSFDLRAEVLPLVAYQEISGFPTDATEILPNTTLNNPGREVVAAGYRVDGTFRLTILYGGFVEWRLFSEGYGAYFTGVGRRKDANENRVADGRVTNITLGTTIAVGWLFPDFPDPKNPHPLSVPWILQKTQKKPDSSSSPY